MSSREETKTPPAMVSGDWSELPWRKLEQHVYRLQKRIYRASCRGNEVVVRRLQQLLMRSRSAQLLATRRVTQDNQGKKTAGVDGKASLTPPERLEMVRHINPKGRQPKPRPVRRVWIPKPGKTEKRPLGIPAMEDRARQALAKQALEPEWEAKFEPDSYGFRPGRSSHDAIEAIFTHISKKSKYVLDADIRGCFDHIDHTALLEKLTTYPAMKRLVKGWLKAGIMEEGNFTPSEEGTPQGGVISPLLANIALHGMERAVWSAFMHKEGKPALVRYADDFVITHPTLAGIERARRVVEEWLKGMGLELKPEKTRIVHTLEGKGAGFNFLGFNVRQYKVSDSRSGIIGGNSKSGKEKLGFKTIIKPSKEAVVRHAKEMKQVIKAHQAAPQGALIARMNPIITGWANYYRTVVSGEAFSRQDQQLYNVLRAWARRRHKKSVAWVHRKYWQWGDENGWTFTDGKHALNKHTKVKIKRHVKVRGSASPYDGNLLYWGQRLRDHPMVNTRTGSLLVSQKGRCAYCGLQFMPGDQVETDHIIPRHLGGEDKMANLQLLHRHCHDQKTAKLDAEMAKASRRYL